jgi:hypothetical protein
MIEVPKEILWDYQEPPEDLLWRLQRIADFFPLYGRDKETVGLLFNHRNQLKLDNATRLLIEQYQRASHGVSE